MGSVCASCPRATSSSYGVDRRYRDEGVELRIMDQSEN
jgi:hypothetical protein